MQRKKNEKGKKDIKEDEPLLNKIDMDDLENGNSNKIKEDQKYNGIELSYKKNQSQNEYLNKNKEKVLSSEKKRYNILLMEKEEESKILNSQKEKLLIEIERFKQKEKEYLNRINVNENLLSTKKEEYENSLGLKDEEIKRLNQEINEKEEKINELKNESTEKEKENQTLKQIIKEKEEKVNGLLLL